MDAENIKRSDYVRAELAGGGWCQGIVAEVCTGPAAGLVVIAVSNPGYSHFQRGESIHVSVNRLSSLAHLDCQQCGYRAHDDDDMAEHRSSNHPS